MAKITLEEQPEFLTFPVDSILDMKIEEANVVTVNGQRGEWQKVEFKFKILGVQALGDGSPVNTFDSMVTQTIWGSVPFRLTDSAENKLRQWAEAIFGMELGLGFELDTDMFVGRRVRGLTGQYEKRTGDQVYKRHQIEALLPAAGGQQGATAAVAATATAPATASGGDPWGTSWGNQGQSEDPPF